MAKGIDSAHKLASAHASSSSPSRFLSVDGGEQFLFDGVRPKLCGSNSIVKGVNRSGICRERPTIKTATFVVISSSSTLREGCGDVGFKCTLTGFQLAQIRRCLSRFGLAGITTTRASL